MLTTFLCHSKKSMTFGNHSFTTQARLRIETCGIQMADNAAMVSVFSV